MRLPKILVLITPCFCAGVEAQLRGRFSVVHSAGNAGNANKIAHDLHCFLSQVPGGRPAVVTFNAGGHAGVRNKTPKRPGLARSRPRPPCNSPRSPPLRFTANAPL